MHTDGMCEASVTQTAAETGVAQEAPLPGCLTWGGGGGSLALGSAAGLVLGRS